jgi:hypothetical protein
MQVSVSPEEFLALFSFRGVVSFSNGVREPRRLDRRANSLGSGKHPNVEFRRVQRREGWLAPGIIMPRNAEGTMPCEVGLNVVT